METIIFGKYGDYMVDGKLVWSPNDIVSAHYEGNIVIGVIQEFTEDKKAILKLKRTRKGIIPKNAKIITVEINDLFN